MPEAVYPILGSRDVPRSIKFYTQKLGFVVDFSDGGDNPNYLGFRRKYAVIHMQFQSGEEFAQTRLRFKTRLDEIDSLHAEFLANQVEITATGLRDTDWGTREFALWDPDGNALTFYAERGH